ncbi:MAG: glycoside hydrolase family 13 protein [Clostridia bacterium]|nr:glycoside hydrolase family 13 protein [Clostridia bacterium]
MPLSHYHVSLEITSAHTDFAHLFSAFDNEDTLTLTLTLSRELGTVSPRLELYEADAHAQTLIFPLVWQGTDYKTETYRLSLSLHRLRGLYFASLLFDSAEGLLRLSYDEGHYRYRLTRSDEAYEPIGLTVYDAAFTTPDWFKGGVLYQIFVDRFYKGSQAVPCREDAVLDPDWERGIPQYPPYRGAPFSNNTFFGGTLFGIAEKMPYLASLGVTALYLSPIFRAYSNHKYDTADYLEIDSMFGGKEGFDAMLCAANAHGIRVILDGVFNHTGDDSRYFNKYGKFDTLGAYQSQESPYYHWYDFESYPDRYRCWWGIDILPSVNTKHPDYRRFIAGENGVIRRYLREGIAGWRLDVADELSEELITDIRRAAREESREALILGEVWEDASNKIAYGALRRYFWGNELDSVMNYPVGNAIVDYHLTQNAAPLFAVLKRLYAHYPKATSDTNMNLLGTHDTERILTRLSGEGENGRSEDELATATLSEERYRLAKSRLMSAYLLLATVPGVPTVFYGDEAGMQGYHDPFNRRPFPWGREDQEILAFYQKIHRLRKEEDIFSKGYFELVEDLPEGVLAYSRFDRTTCLTAVFNRSDKGITLFAKTLFPKSLSPLCATNGCELLTGQPIRYTVSLKSCDFSLIKWKIDTDC